MENNYEMIPFMIISKGGDASSSFLQALNSARQGKIEEAKVLVSQGEKSLLEAHKIQTDLIVAEASGQKNEVGVLMIHAQDHLMNAILLKEIALHLIELYYRFEMKEHA